jgi:hypothetical protein
MRTVQGKSAYGLPLDGGKSHYSQCSHQKFTGLDGTPGVDNQMYRVIGCMFGFRQDGEGGYLEKFFNQMMLDGESTILIEIKGVTDMRHDRVQVGIFQGTTPKGRGGQGSPVRCQLPDRRQPSLAQPYSRHHRQRSAHDGPPRHASASSQE